MEKTIEEMIQISKNKKGNKNKLKCFLTLFYFTFYNLYVIVLLVKL